MSTNLTKAQRQQHYLGFFSSWPVNDFLKFLLLLSWTNQAKYFTFFSKAYYLGLHKMSTGLFCINLFKTFEVQRRCCKAVPYSLRGLTPCSSSSYVIVLKLFYLYDCDYILTKRTNIQQMYCSRLIHKKETTLTYEVPFLEKK